MAGREDSHPGLSKSARELALRILHRVETKQAFATPLLEQALSDRMATSLSRSDRALVTELVNGGLRWRKRLDHSLAQFCRHDLESLTPWIRNILRLGAYQILFLDRVPASAACDESVKLARRYGHAGTVSLVNAVLRKLAAEASAIEFPDPQADPAAYLAVFYSHPQWLVERWSDRWGREETEALCQANNRVPPTTIRVNSLRANRDQVMKELSEAGIRARATPYSPVGVEVMGGGPISQLPGFQTGHFSGQGEGSILVGYLVAPEPGWRVVDLCSGVGGKTTHLAELMDNRGEILACDLHGWKLELIEENCRRLGIEIVRTREGDSRRLLPDSNFDVCLVDAPCTGTGTLSRRPDLRWRIAPEQMEQLSQLQRELLRAGAEMLRPGGILVYCTCSLEPEENEQVAADFLAAHPDFQVEQAEEYPDCFPPDSFLPSGQGAQLLPHRHGTDGMYSVRIRKRGMK